MKFSDNVYNLLSTKDATFIKLKFASLEDLFNAFLEYFNLDQGQLKALMSTGDTKIDPMFKEFCDHVINGKKEIKVTSALVKEEREKLGISMFDAKRNVMKRLTLEAIDDAKTVEDLKPILKVIVEGLV